MYVLICENDGDETWDVLATSRSMAKLKKLVKTDYEEEAGLEWEGDRSEVVAEWGNDFTYGSYRITKVKEL